MSELLILAWLMAGSGGGALIWANTMMFDARLYRRAPIWCPTPRAIIGMLACAILGPVIVVAGLAITFIERQETLTRTHSWLATPICKKREDRNV